MPVSVPELPPAKLLDITMINDTAATNGHGLVSRPESDDSSPQFTVKAGLAKMLKGGVIMDVVNAEQVRTETHSFSQAIRC